MNWLYDVHGRRVTADPDLEHLIPETLYEFRIHQGRPYTGADAGLMNFAPLPIAALLQSLGNGSVVNAFEVGSYVGKYLRHCRVALELVESTQSFSCTQSVVEEGPVTPPSASRNRIIIDGLQRTIQVLEQLQ